MTDTRKTYRDLGFTLTELLVVLGIVAVLVAVLLPVLGRAREGGRRATCQSNLRQLGAAVQQYVSDNDGAYPLEVSLRLGAGPNDLPVAFDWNHAVLPYLRIAGVFRCPSRGTPREAGGEDYSYNGTRLNTFAPGKRRLNVRGTHEAALPQSATIWLNVDSGYSTPDGVFHDLREVKTSCGRRFFGSTRHGGNGGNYSFLDGHVRWLTPEAMGEIECRNDPLPFPFRD